MAKQRPQEPMSDAARYWFIGFAFLFGLRIIYGLGDGFTRQMSADVAMFLATLSFLYSWDQSQLEPRLPGRGRKRRQADRANAQADTPLGR